MSDTNNNNNNGTHDNNNGNNFNNNNNFNDTNKVFENVYLMNIISGYIRDVNQVISDLQNLNINRVYLLPDNVFRLLSNLSAEEIKEMYKGENESGFPSFVHDMVLVRMYNQYRSNNSASLKDVQVFLTELINLFGGPTEYFNEERINIGLFMMWDKQ